MTLSPNLTPSNINCHTCSHPPSCEGLAVVAEMCASPLPISEITLIRFRGKTPEVQIFTAFARSLLLILLLFRFPGSGSCSEVPLLSEPIGFQISGFDRSRVWVSPNGLFAFGFLNCCDGGGEGDGFMVGIRYTESANVPVWTVGGGLRVSENYTLSLSGEGKLVLVNNPNNLTMWSSPAFGAGVQKVTLLNNGNLVLMDSMNNVLWDSFGNPTNTLLPGQSLRFPQTLRAPSTKNTTSFYNCVIRQSSGRGELALVWESNTAGDKPEEGEDDVKSSCPLCPGRHTCYNGRDKGSRSREVELTPKTRPQFGLQAATSRGVLRLVDDSNTTLWSKESQDSEDPSGPLRHLSMDRDGNLRIYSWNRETRTWKVGWQAVQDQCNVFASCGLFSVCGYNSTGPFCDCLYQDPLNSMKGGSSGFDLGSSGCRKIPDLTSCQRNSSMIPIKHTSLYAVYPPGDFEVMLSEKACKEYCSNDTTCIAITSRNDGSGLCTVKRTSFISGSTSLSSPSTSYLKAVATGGADTHQFQYLPPPESKRLTSDEGSKGLVGGIALVVAVTVCGFLAMQLVLFRFMYRKRQLRAHTRIPFGKDAHTNLHFSVARSRRASANFFQSARVLMFQRFASKQSSGCIKVLSDVTAPEKEFRITVSTLGGIHHRNLVPLKGFCFEPKHKCLIYEYVSLDKWLSRTQQDGSPEAWWQKLNIATGIARALAYLHLECQRCIPHGNLKLQNVMLDDNLVPKVTDYGLRSLFQRDEATSSESPSERDIYAFGELLLQILSHQEGSVSYSASDLPEQVNLRQVSKCSDEWERMRRIALWCVQSQPFLRPSIGEVVKVLDGTLTVDIPPSPFGSRQYNQTEGESSSGEIGVEDC
uniref:Receptor-like serine/threonine-protein kinase n=1 Tax=Kalanchoe fedtschenkoi TaxID=63787 RepID=A0A7N0UFB6_KALFE